MKAEILFEGTALHRAEKFHRFLGSQNPENQGQYKTLNVKYKLMFLK